MQYGQLCTPGSNRSSPRNGARNHTMLAKIEKGKPGAQKTRKGIPCLHRCRETSHIKRRRHLALRHFRHFLWPDGQTDEQTFSFVPGDADRRQSAAPPTSWPHKHGMTRSHEQQVDVLDDLSYPCIFISHAWSSFHRCGANLRFSAL